MTELEIKIIRLIKANFTLNQILDIVKIDHKTFWEILFNLRKKGYSFDRKYYSSGDIIYNYTNNPASFNDSASIITAPEETEFTALLTSDLHIGRNGKYSIFGSRERLDILDNCFNYCAKEGIHTIINGGDFIDSFMNFFVETEDVERAQEEQINYAIERYPYDKNILTYLCLGNHDFDALLRTNQDIALALHERRHDIIPIGYESGIIRIKNDAFGVFHKLDNGTTQRNLKLVKTFWLKGHSHQTRFNFRNSIPSIYIPTLMDDEDSRNMSHPVLKMTIKFEHGYFKLVIIEQLLAGYGFMKVNDCVFELNKNKKIKEDSPVELEESPILTRRK